MITWQLLGTVAVRPRLWGEGTRTLLAVAPLRWWRKRPFLPVPDQSYASWRLATAHGDASIPLSSDELISYLEWRRRQHRPLRRV